MRIGFPCKSRVAAVALGLVLACTPALVFAPEPAFAGALYLTSCSGFGDSGADSDLDGSVWGGFGNGSFGYVNRCAQGGAFQLTSERPSGPGQGAIWETTPPPSITIAAAYTPPNEVLVSPRIAANGYKAKFFWAGGAQFESPTSSCCGGQDYAQGINRTDLGASGYFGWQAYCARASCPPIPGGLLEVRGIDLEGIDNTPPTLNALGGNNLWYQGGNYVRGSGWPTSFQASASDGVCAMVEQVDGRTLVGPSDPYPNRHSWTQCPTPVTMNQSIDTTQYPNGPLSLTLAAHDAASPANLAGASQTLHVDNAPVALALTGPTDAPSTAGTQYVSASAGAGASGVRSIACSVDGGAYRGYPALAQIPVTGLGAHQVLCVASNNAFDVYSRPAVSPVESRSLSIREPTAITASFAQQGALRCSRHSERVYVPGHRVRRRRHGKIVYVRRPGHFHTVKVLRCSAPPVTTGTSERVAFGHDSTIGGELLASDGTALGGQQVRIMTAPDNGLNQFSQVAIATTAANGSWSATLPPGPSRIVQAAYAGGGTTEPSASAAIHMTVPAKVVLVRIYPRRVASGGTVQIVGEVAGGYLPAEGALVRLRLGYGRGQATYGVETHVTGRFTTTYTFGSVPTPLRVCFSIASLPEGDFPYAPSSSACKTVIVGGHPSPAPAPPSAHHHKRR